MIDESYGHSEGATDVKDVDRFASCVAANRLDGELDHLLVGELNSSVELVAASFDDNDDTAVPVAARFVRYVDISMEVEMDVENGITLL